MANIEKKHFDLPVDLDKSVDQLINAINSDKKLIDCELAQLLGDINMAESWGLINSGLAKELREYYIDTILRSEYGKRL